ncbi:MAG: hypothetical protein AAF264_10175 [Pseudomonadota bacterium]
MDPKPQKTARPGESWLLGLAVGAGVITLVATILPIAGISAPDVRIDGMVGVLTGR